MTRRGTSPLLLIAMLAATLAPCTAGHAQGRPAQASRRLLFNIPAQPLSGALEAFGTVTGHQVIYDSRIAEHRVSRPVIGVYDAESALRILLDGTDLTIRYTGPNDVAIVPVPVRRGARPGEPGSAHGGVALTLDTLQVEVPADTPDRPDFNRYGREVREAVRKALGRDADTAGRSYHVQFDVRVTPAGKLEQPRILRHSGRIEIDRALARALRTITIGTRPPRDLPQPVRITIISI